MRKQWITLLSCLLLATAPGLAQVVTTIHLNDIPDVSCGEVWVQDGVDMYFTETTKDDCDGGGSCFFGVGPEGAWLYPARLVVDFGESYAVQRVEIDIVDYCGIGCTRAFLYDGDLIVAEAMNEDYGSQVLVLEPMTPPSKDWVQADRLAISSCEGLVTESTIRIYADALPDEAPNWGMVKSLYR